MCIRDRRYGPSPIINNLNFFSVFKDEILSDVYGIDIEVDLNNRRIKYF